MIDAKVLAVGPRKRVGECTGQADFEKDYTNLRLSKSISEKSE
jgi:hypothetical protein